MSSIAVFDFDRTIVNDDSDATIIRKLEEIRTAPKWDESGNWTPYMADNDVGRFPAHCIVDGKMVFQHAYAAGMRKKDILRAIESMNPTPHIKPLFHLLKNNGWDILIISDANSVFVNHWLTMHELRDCVTDIITNQAFWRDDLLFIRPCMNQTTCPRCASNLCKSVALAQWLQLRPPYASVIYVGDGINDYCPATSLAPQATLYPRRNYALYKAVKKTLKSRNPEINSRVVPWEDCQTIIDDLFPDQFVS